MVWEHVDTQVKNSHTDRLYYHEFKVILWRHFESLVFWIRLQRKKKMKGHWISNGSYELNKNSNIFPVSTFCPSPSPHPPSSTFPVQPCRRTLISPLFCFHPSAHTHPTPRPFFKSIGPRTSLIDRDDQFTLIGEYTTHFEVLIIT